MADAIATAYVKLIPTFDGQLGKTISREMGAADTKSEGNKAGKQYTKGAESGMSNLSDAVKGKFSAATVAIGNLMSNAITSAVSSAASGISSLMSTAFSGFSDYQQLNSGMKLAFGDAFSYIEEKSQRAFETVGLSQNDYLRQVNGFAVGLKTSMGGSEQAAAELADKIVSAEADIVAAMGISEEAAQNAFNGVMKGNYMMLDNLQIGIKPTKEGMQEVIDKVNEWNAAQGKASQYTIDNLADCEAALVDYVDMVGYAGYAQGEAFETVSGSIAMLKGAWTNLISSLGRKDADFGQLSKDLTESLSAVFNNVAPLLGTIATNVMDNVPMIFDGIGKAIEETLLPKMKEAFSNVLDKLGIDFDDAKMSGALEGLSKTFGKLTDELGKLGDMVGPKVSGFFSEMGPVVVSIADAVLQVVDAFVILGQGMSYLADSFGSSFAAVPGTIIGFFEGVPSAVGGFFADACLAAQDAFDALVSFVTGIPEQIIGFFRGIGQRITEAIGSIHFPTPHVSWEALEIAGMTTPVKLPHVEWYARGGIFDRATVLAGVGEAGPEAAIPLSGHYMRPFARAIASEMGGGGSTFNITVNASGDGEDIARTITRAIRQQELMGRR